uniref:mobilization protein n=1 Tax=Streptomyces parvus TaxID=66428 RepID=UPI00371B36CD
MMNFNGGRAVQDRLEKLKQQKARIDRQIALAMAAERKTLKREDDRVKVLVGAAILEQVKRNQFQLDDLLGVMDGFLARDTERAAVLGEGGTGSKALLRLTGREAGQGGGR